ncbi:MAG: HAMP domain-containing sensor histidine kinase [Myxococcota bacterium]
MIRLRWLAVALFALATVVAAQITAQFEVLAGAVAVVTVATVSNIALQRTRTLTWSTDSIVGPIVLLDIGLLTLLLALTGGPGNPFSVLYVVYVALAATLLRPVWMWTSAFVASAAFASLFFWHLPLPAELGGMHQHDGGYSVHLQGMWIAFVVAAAAIVAFVSRLASALRREERERARTAELLGLATLAAGAAHEIGNPLGTIRIAVDEVRDACRQLGAERQTLSDLDLIAAEVARARRVLDRMTIGATQLGEDSHRRTSVRSIVDSVLDDVGPADKTRVALDWKEEPPEVRWPREAVGQILLQVLRNALRATSGTVELRCTSGADSVRLAVTDQGPGMPHHVIAKSTEPFFTTRPEEGMGLGLFIARSLVEHLGGRIEIHSAPERGTEVNVLLPLEATA